MRSDWLRPVGAVFLRRQVGRNLGTVQGLGNLPQEGGFVLVPNHTSYLDHFVLDFLLEAVQDRTTWFLTKRESFEKPLLRAWSTAWHGIPVDRDRPSAETLRTVQAVLADGAALCVYPEGTRNPNPEHLLEFKTGAFHFAATANVPVVPVVIVGADQVLARGERRFRRGRINVRFGSPIYPDASRPKPERVKRTLECARSWMEASLTEMRSARADDIIDTNGLTARTTNLVHKGQLAGRRKRALLFVVRSLGRSNPGSIGPVKAHARIRGLDALALRGPLKWPLLAAAARDLRRALRLNPSDADAHYYLGTVFATHPGRASQAREHLEASTRLTRQTDPRPLLALAQLEARSGDPRRVEQLLDTAAAALDEHDGRTPARTARIASLRRGLEQVA
ncbi:1-acyl-sn-glycerol-3-phosphate acyltransferase [Microbacterium lacticum]